MFLSCYLDKFLLVHYDSDSLKNSLNVNFLFNINSIFKSFIMQITILNPTYMYLKFRLESLIFFKVILIHQYPFSYIWMCFLKINNGYNIFKILNLKNVNVFFCCNLEINHRILLFDLLIFNKSRPRSLLEFTK
jgi:hypothetical protein